MNRYATYVNHDDIDMVLNNIEKHGGKIVSVSCTYEGYLVIYKAKKIIKEEILKEFGN